MVVYRWCVSVSRLVVWRTSGLWGAHGECQEPHIYLQEQFHCSEGMGVACLVWSGWDKPRCPLICMYMWLCRCLPLLTQNTLTNKRYNGNVHVLVYVCWCVYSLSVHTWATKGMCVLNTIHPIVPAWVQRIPISLWDFTCTINVWFSY